MNSILKEGHILLPSANIPMEKWAVIACDQFTSQPKYWADAEAITGTTPSTLNLILPEAYLSEGETRIPAIHKVMSDYLANGVLTEGVYGFVLTERETKSGIRQGLIVTLDLDQYDPNAGSVSPIRATEATVPARVPPRAKIRRDAPIETSHIMMLIDDPDRTVIEPLYARRDTLRSLYDFDLMLDGGHMRGWAVEGTDAACVFKAIESMSEKCNDLLFAVGDGNHSLAAAKMCWEQIKETLPMEDRAAHPARYAMVELVNLNCPAMIFEPIHRIVYNVDPTAMQEEFLSYLKNNGVDMAAGNDLVIVNGEGSLKLRSDVYPLPMLQSFLMEYVASHPGSQIDYIHDESALRELVSAHPDSLGFMPRAFAKNELFPEIRRNGSLPCKAFSMGTATEKRYYLETRRIL